jgi:hypothetical protein
MRVARGIEDLEKIGAVTTTGSFETYRKHYRGLDDDWVDPPTITLIEPLRAISRSVLLGEVLNDLP